jgi:hypothetical protein
MKILLTVLLVASLCGCVGTERKKIARQYNEEMGRAEELMNEGKYKDGNLQSIIHASSTWALQNDRANNGTASADATRAAAVAAAKAGIVSEAPIETAPAAPAVPAAPKTVQEPVPSEQGK